MIVLSVRRQATLKYLTWITYVLATVQVVRFYMTTEPGINIETYLQGTTPLPFQKRYLPAILIKGMLHIPPLVHFLLSHHLALASPALGCTLILAGISLGIAGYFCIKLYRAVSPPRTLELLVYPLFLATVLVSYAVHVERNTNLPYDFPSLAFFTAGLYVIYTRKFLPLFFIVLVGTLNRETTLFLIVIYVLDCASVQVSAENRTWWRERLRFSQIPWLRVFLLCLAWVVVEGALSYHFAGNDRRHAHIRISENLHRLKPENWPVLLNICGYLLPFVLVLQPAIRPARFGNYSLVAPLWIAVMICYGVITETRIYGELVPYITVATVLLLEQYLGRDTPIATDPVLLEG
jgi:hypothetical protein